MVLIIIKMIQNCGETIALPLILIFETALKEKNVANVVPFHQKDEKDLLKNYYPISLLPICSRTLERVIYNFLFNHYLSNNRSYFRLKLSPTFGCCPR